MSRKIKRTVYWETFDIPIEMIEWGDGINWTEDSPVVTGECMFLPVYAQGEDRSAFRKKMYSYITHYFLNHLSNNWPKKGDGKAHPSRSVVEKQIRKQGSGVHDVERKKIRRTRTK